MLKLQWSNGFCLLIPVLLLNIALSSKLAHPAFEYDEAISNWVLLLENFLRLGVMLLPLFMPLRWYKPQFRMGFRIYIIGVIIYFTSWIPLIIFPESAWSNSLIGFLAPAYTPLIWLVGIGLIGGWWPYLFLSTVFVGVHLIHWYWVYHLV